MSARGRRTIQPRSSAEWTAATAGDRLTSKGHGSSAVHWSMLWASTDVRELDDHLMRQCALIVDSRDAVRKESGDVILSEAPILAEAGELFAGTKARPSIGSTTVFKSVGLQPKTRRRQLWFIANP
jgi:Ornithine cyclodeaminase/mu-crystallin family